MTPAAQARIAELATRAAGLAAGGRAILGITGAPGSGKSTLAELLVAELVARGFPVAAVPMDGYHLADAALDRLGLRDRKGAIATFDGHGFLALLRRLRTETGNVVYAPDFERTLEQPIAGSIGVGPEIRIVVTEGIHLLREEDPWPRVHAELTETWYAELPEPERLARLHARHVRFGKSPAGAHAWIAAVDQPNAERVAARRGHADLVVPMDGLGAPPG
ncbi:MAG: nucleoside/nucleotide kinase family protein [Chloroflexota bacterium]